MSAYLLLRAAVSADSFTNAAIVLVSVEEIGRSCQGRCRFIRRPPCLLVRQSIRPPMKQKVLELRPVIFDVTRHPLKFGTSHQESSMPGSRVSFVRAPSPGELQLFVPVIAGSSASIAMVIMPVQLIACSCEG